MRIEFDQFCDVGKFSLHTPRARAPEAAPGWTSGLRQLYSGLVEEPVPTDLDELLDRLEHSAQQKPKI